MSNEPQNISRLAKNTGYMYIRMFLVLIVGLYVERIVLHSLGIEDYGIYTLVGGVVTFFIYLKVALTNATYRHLAFEIGRGNDSKELSEIYSMAINCHIILAVALVIIGEVVGVWFLNYHLDIRPERMVAANWVYQFSLLTFAISVVQTPYNSLIIAHEKMNFFALLSVVEVLLKLGVAILLVRFAGDQLILYGGLLAVVTIVVTLVYWAYCHWAFKDCRYGKCWNPKWVKTFASYSGWSLMVNAIDVTNVQVIPIFFNWFISITANGAWGITSKVISQLNNFLHAFTQAFDPQIIKSYAAGDRKYFMQLIHTTSKLSYLLLFLVCLPLAANLEFVLDVWLVEYPEMTISFILAAMIYYLIDAVQCPLWQAVYATGNLRTHQILMASVKVLAIPAMYFALKHGVNGAIAILIWGGVNMLSAIVRTIYMRHLIALDLKHYVYDVVGKLIIATMIAVPLPFYIVHTMGKGWESFLVSSCVAVVLTLATGYLICLNGHERQYINTLVHHRICRK